MHVFLALVLASLLAALTGDVAAVSTSKPSSHAPTLRPTTTHVPTNKPTSLSPTTGGPTTLQPTPAPFPTLPPADCHPHFGMTKADCKGLGPVHGASTELTASRQAAPI